MEELKNIVLEKNEQTGLARGLFEVTTEIWQLERSELVSLVRELDYALRNATEEEKYDKKGYNHYIKSVFDTIEELEN